MLRKIGIALAAGALASTGAVAQDTAKVGLVLPLTGGLAPVGKQVQAGAKLYMDKHGDTVAGKKIELIVKDDAGVPDNSKRLAQELIVNDKVAVIGSALTPSAMAIGPLSTQGKTANVVMVSGTSGVINPNNPYMVRTSFTLGAAVRHHRGMGGEERQQESRDRAIRLGPWRRSRGRVHRQLHQGRRPGRGNHQGAARQSRFCAVPAARARSQSRHPVRVRAGGPGRDLRQAVRRARPRQGRASS